MRVNWVLIGFAILYLLFALSFLPMQQVLPGPIEEAWGLVTNVLWAAMTVLTISLLEVVDPLASPLASASGLRRGDAAEILLAVILIAVAVYAVTRLLRTDLTDGRRGAYTFLLLLAVTLVAMVRFTLHSWSHFA